MRARRPSRVVRRRGPRGRPVVKPDEAATARGACLSRSVPDGPSRGPARLAGAYVAEERLSSTRSLYLRRPAAVLVRPRRSRDPPAPRGRRRPRALRSSCLAPAPEPRRPDRQTGATAGQVIHRPGAGRWRRHHHGRRGRPGSRGDHQRRGSRGILRPRSTRPFAPRKPRMMLEGEGQRGFRPRSISHFRCIDRRAATPDGTDAPSRSDRCGLDVAPGERERA